MRFDFALWLFAMLTAVAAAGIEPRRHVVRIEPEAQSDEHDLFKRKGGGGRGGRGGNSGNNGGGGGGGGGSRGTPQNARQDSNAGGRTREGSGPQPSYGGGNSPSYGGGARAPYAAGRTGAGGLAPYAFIGAGAGLAFWPGTWYGGAHMYQYPHSYRYHNSTKDEDEQKQVLCACAEDEVCSCEENNSTMKELVGDGSYRQLNKSIIDVGEVNGTQMFLVNGTLPKGTTLKDINADEDGEYQGQQDAANSLRGLAEALGFWPAVAAVGCAVLMA